MMEKNQIVFNMVVLLSVLFLSFYGTKVHSVIVEQPLSKIAIHKATVALTDSASIKASPLVLGRTGEDYEWVVVDFENTDPSNDDWIGVFSPAIFNGSVCHFESEPDYQGKICSAPIKYHFANYSNSDYVKTGKASLEFRLINQREDFSFALFQGGLSNPHLVALSNSISFENPKAPLYPRLAQGKSWNEMAITWTSGYNPHEAIAIVEWGRKGQENEKSPAIPVTFNRNRMYGSPASTFGWRDPGFVHTSSLADLWPNTVYTYQMGHILLSNEHIIWSKAYSFRSPPSPGQDSLQQVIILGNMGKAELDGSNEYANYQRGSFNTTEQLVNDLNDIDMVFHMGEMVYANGYISQWDQFTEQIKTITSGVPYMIASGNHERDLPAIASVDESIESGGDWGVPAMTMFYVPAHNTAKLWYSTDYGMFRFCVADSEYELEEGSEQYEFIRHCLSSVNRLKQPWLIFVVHQPPGNFSAEKSMQKLWHKYKVDIVFYGHVHNYERTCPLYENKCVNSERSHYSGTANGTIHVEVGGSGSHISQFSKLNTSWSLYKDFDYGFVKLTSLNQSTLLFEYKKSSDGKVYDSFTIHREFRDLFSWRATTSAI